LQEPEGKSYEVLGLAHLVSNVSDGNLSLEEQLLGTFNPASDDVLMGLKTVQTLEELRQIYQRFDFS
jgi:hypothetical protein